MGLMGIQDVDVLCYFIGLTHCPWCRKEDQKEGSIVNHLQTVHYKLGLICEKCFGCLSIMSEAVCHHGQKDCQPSGEGGPDESSSSAKLLARSGLGQSYLNRNLDGGSKGGSGVPHATSFGIAPLPHWHGPGREPDGGGTTCQPNTSPSPQSSCTQIGLMLSSMNLELSMMFIKDAGLYEH